MINVYFLVQPTGEAVGFSIAGHAGYAESGRDILCAAVSSAAYMVVNMITDVLMLSPLTLREDESGELFLRLHEKDAAVCRDVFSGLKLHLLNLEQQYEDAINVDYMEV